MHDLKDIRDNPAGFDAALARRSLPPRAGEILALDAETRALTVTLNELQARRNAASKAIGAAKAKQDHAEAARLMADVDAVKREMPELEARQSALAAAISEILAALPNAPAADAPDGRDEAGNVEIRRVGAPREIAKPREHFDLGEALGLMDFETASAMSGARFVLLKGALSRLERALANFMLDLHTGEFGYVECSPPFMVRDAAAFGTGQLPKFGEDLFKTTNGFWLIPTAEVSLTNTLLDKIIEEEALPIRLTAWTPCFRSEAGAAGRDTRGLIRMHQFSKVELVSITAPEGSHAEHERMTACAEEVLKRLDLPFRTMALCTGDMGFSAQKTYDIEVWLPGQGRYREISSCSNCGAFQARRMKARLRRKGGKGTEPVHTLNGSGLAVGRTIVAILENYQNPDGSVSVPAALSPYMGGLTRIEKAT